MTRLQLDRAVARATGEPIRLIRNRGFSLLDHKPIDEDLDLAVTCPHCRERVADPGHARDGSPLLAECLTCDVLFSVTPAAVSVARLDPAQAP